MMREFHLTQADMLEISDHLPIWAEFSVYEGGRRHTCRRVRIEDRRNCMFWAEGPQVLPARNALESG